MYQMYKQWSDERQKEKVSCSIYRKNFLTEFNIGFHKPLKDQCDLMKMQIIKNKKK